MHLCRRTEFTFLLNEVVPLLGVPLAALYDTLRLGDEIGTFGTILQQVARRHDGSLPKLRTQLFSYTTTTLRSDASRKLEENIFWLYDAIRSPQVIPLRAMVPHR